MNNAGVVVGMVHKWHGKKAWSSAWFKNGTIGMVQAAVRYTLPSVLSPHPLSCSKIQTNIIKYKPKEGTQ
jgi:hypothetical protein